MLKARFERLLNEIGTFRHSRNENQRQEHYLLLNDTFTKERMHADNNTYEDRDQVLFVYSRKDVQYNFLLCILVEGCYNIFSL